VEGVKNYFSCIRHSFAPGTLVLMADGSKKPIEKVKPGDKVLATDPVTGKTTEKTVVATHINLDVDLTDLVIGEGAVLQTTAHHPFWSKDQSAWVDAADLEQSESLAALDGSSLRVSTVTSYSAARVMYDLTVDTVHTYYVLAGKTPVLVHNCGGSANSHLSDLPVHPDINKFNVRAGELVNNRFGTHALNPHQMNGGEIAGHGGVRNLTNAQLIARGGPQGNDPIRGARDWGPGDCGCYPASRVYVTGGHHRTAEIARRVGAGEMSPDTLIEFVISPP
jgi:hypothetical protein